MGERKNKTQPKNLKQLSWDGQTYIKKVYREEEGLRLVSLNNHYADKFAPYDENPHIIGKIIGNFKPLAV